LKTSAVTAADLGGGQLATLRDAAQTLLAHDVELS
jgi:hypothetical protein